MKDMEQHLLKLRTDAEECSNISRRATDPQKRELFARLAQHLNVLASEVARDVREKSRRSLLGASRSHFLMEA